MERFSVYYDRLLRPNHEPDGELRKAIDRLNTFDFVVAYPFMLGLLDRYLRGVISRNDVLEVCGVLENFMVRRYLAGEPTNYLNKMFPTLWKDLDSQPEKNLASALKRELSTKKYPSDNRIRQQLLTRRIYDGRSNRKISFILGQINRLLSQNTGGYTVLEGDPTIEHILPQSDQAKWRHDLGQAEWELAYRDYLHTLGNLTIVSQEWNSQLSDSLFTVKKAALTSHALLLNALYFNIEIERWNAQAIQDRCNWLVELILQLYPSFSDVTVIPTRRKPRALVLLGEEHEVKSWRGLAYALAQQIADFADDFDSIATGLPRYFSREPFKVNGEVGIGWNMNLYLGQRSVPKLCNYLVNAVGLSHEDWVIIYKED